VLARPDELAPSFFSFPLVQWGRCRGEKFGFTHTLSSSFPFGVPAVRTSLLFFSLGHCEQTDRELVQPLSPLPFSFFSHTKRRGGEHTKKKKIIAHANKNRSSASVLRRVSFFLPLLFFPPSPPSRGSRSPKGRLVRPVGNLAPQQSKLAFKGRAFPIPSLFSSLALRKKRARGAYSGNFMYPGLIGGGQPYVFFSPFSLPLLLSLFFSFAELEALGGQPRSRRVRKSNFGRQDFFPPLTFPFFLLFFAKKKEPQKASQRSQKKVISGRRGP